MLQGERFDPVKFARSFVWMIVVAVISLLVGMPPEIILSEYATVIEQAVAFLMNNGAGIALIWFFDRLYTVIKTLASKLTTSMAAAKPG